MEIKRNDKQIDWSKENIEELLSNLQFDKEYPVEDIGNGFLIHFNNVIPSFPDNTWVTFCIDYNEKTLELDDINNFYILRLGNATGDVYREALCGEIDDNIILPDEYKDGLKKTAISIFEKSDVYKSFISQKEDNDLDR